MIGLPVAQQAATVTPADGTDLPAGACAWLYVGTSGDISADVGGVTVLFKSVPVGPLWVRISRVRSTLTTALTMLAMY